MEVSSISNHISWRKRLGRKDWVILSLQSHNYFQWNMFTYSAFTSVHLLFNLIKIEYARFMSKWAPWTVLSKSLDGKYSKEIFQTICNLYVIKKMSKIAELDITLTLPHKLLSTKRGLSVIETCLNRASNCQEFNASKWVLMTAAVCFFSCSSVIKCFFVFWN